MTDAAMLKQSSFARRENDAYWTEPRVTEALLGKVRLRGDVWEPACGRGDMVRVLQAHGYTVHASDIKRYDGAPEDTLTLDFLDVARIWPRVETIITNPPYSHAVAFIERAITLMRPVRGMVVMLLRNEFDSAKGRRKLFETPIFKTKYVLTFRPRWIDCEDGGTQASPRHWFSWFLWDHRHVGPATMEWLP